MTDITDALDALVALMDRMSIRYVVMGGLAVRAYAVPRATQDIDVTIALERDRLLDVFTALEQEGYSVPEPYKTGWVDEVQGLPLVKARRYVRDRGLDVDIFLAESAFQDELLKRRRRADVEGRLVWLVTPEDLVLLKLLAGRPRDMIDVAEVLFMQGQLDEEYMRRWAGELGVADALEKALAEQTKEE